MVELTFEYVIWAIALGAISAVSLPLGSLVGIKSNPHRYVNMRMQGFSKTRVFLLWFSLLVITAIGAGVGFRLADSVSHSFVVFAEGLAAGVMLTMDRRGDDPGSHPHGPGDRCWLEYAQRFPGSNFASSQRADSNPKRDYRRREIMANEVKATTFENTKLSTVPLDWKEVYYTNCPLVSASNVDQELGWTREEYKKIGVKYAFMRSVRENDWYPHYIHNLDNLIRFGGLFPPVHVHADIRRTRLLGVTHAPHEGGCMMVRARDDIYRMVELKGKKIGLSKSMNQVKNDWWRIQEHQGIELMLRMNGMTMRRRGDRGIPLCGRLVQQSRHAGSHGKPVGIVAQA